MRCLHLVKALCGGHRFHNSLISWNCKIFSQPSVINQINVSITAQENKGQLLQNELAPLQIHMTFLFIVYIMLAFQGVFI